MPPSRLVLTHTQHLPGLIWILRKLIDKSDAIKAVVPTRIAFVGSRSIYTCNDDILFLL